MFTAIGDRTTAIEVARQSDDPEIRTTVKGIRTTGPATMHRIRATLRKALNDAIRKRLLEFNPAAHVELPSGARPKARVWTANAVQKWRETGQRPSPVMVWTPQQAGQFLDYAEDHDIVLYPLFVLILHRGLRRGEAVGLPDHAVDLDNALVAISRQLTTVGYDPVVKDVKSDAGDRVVSPDSFTLAALRAYHARRSRWTLVCGGAWPDIGFFFVQPDGQPWHPETVTWRFERLVRDAGLPPVRLHDLRHCAATYLKAAGADLKDVQELLGHSSITITGDTYTTVIAELDVERAKAEAAAALVPRGDGQRREHAQPATRRDKDAWTGLLDPVDTQHADASAPSPMTRGRHRPGGSRRRGRPAGPAGARPDPRLRPPRRPGAPPAVTVEDQSHTRKGPPAFRWPGATFSRRRPGPVPG
jgi:integrase